MSSAPNSKRDPNLSAERAAGEGRLRVYRLSVGQARMGPVTVRSEPSVPKLGALIMVMFSAAAALLPFISFGRLIRCPEAWSLIDDQQIQRRLN